MSFERKPRQGMESRLAYLDFAVLAAQGRQLVAGCLWHWTPNQGFRGQCRPCNAAIGSGARARF